MDPIRTIRNRPVGMRGALCAMLTVCAATGARAKAADAAASPPTVSAAQSSAAPTGNTIAYDLKAVPIPDLPEAVRSRLTSGGSFARVREGLIQVGDTQRKVFLGHRGGSTAGFDLPITALYLLPADRPIRIVPSWIGGQQLSSTYRRGDSFYRFSATSAGDKLFVRRYDGPLGTLQVGIGDRQVSEVSMTGSVGTPDMAVLVSEERDTGGSVPVRSCRLPVGDYYPGFLNITYDRLQFGILRNYHADGQPRARIANRSQPGAIRIRADRPFVLDFSGKPQVLFALPAKDQRIQRGAELSVKGVLIDPALDIMFRYIRQDRQLDPKVVIKRANGEIVTRGAMPFG
jgi:hypothetical protein